MAASKSDKSKPSDKKVFDVAKPGKSAPDATARPVIVGHKPMIQDPMVNASDTGTETAPVENDEKVTPIRSAKKIVPLGDKAPENTSQAKDETPKEADEPGAVDMQEKTEEDQAAEVSKDETAGSEPEPNADKPTDEPAPKPSEETADSPSTSEAAAVDALASQATRKKEGELTEEEKKKIEAINKLIEDKTYYVKVAQANHKRNATLFILLGLILVVIIGGALAIDAGMINPGVTLPFDLISN
jgi:hypothetical protein